MNTINYGASEPPRHTRWEGADGCEWAWDGDLGDWNNFTAGGEYVSRHRWRVIHPDNFPMTEVTR